MRNQSSYHKLRAVVRGGEVRAPVSARLPLFFGASVAAEEWLATLCVLIVGLGSVGRAIALHLARLGVGALYLIDPRAYKAESLLTHPISPTDIGAAKATNTARLCKAISPAMRVFAYRGLVQDLGLAGLLNVNWVILATDNLEVELDVGRMCGALGVPLLHAAVEGTTLTVQVRHYSNQTPASPCPACGMTAQEKRLQHREQRFSCEAYRVSPAAAAAASAVPTMAPSFLCAVAADCCVNVLLRAGLRLGPPTGDAEWQYNGYTGQTVSTPLAPNPGCVYPHERYERKPSSVPLAACTPRALAAAAAMPLEQLTLAVDRMSWIESAACSCPALRAVRRFAAHTRESVGRCPRCRDLLMPATFYRLPAVLAAQLGAAVDQPLGRLGVTSASWVLLRHADRAVLFTHLPAKLDQTEAL